MPGKVFFTQLRIGKDGKAFKLIKFRTMVESHSTNHITIKGDVRITPFGAWLRKYKLDELPELWNVLKGYMSFVGNHFGLLNEGKNHYIRFLGWRKCGS